ncbi:hypothetical protein M2404_003675 [Rheinheimera pacifica]|uniref:hypothetical protein n=1 Tax=Rheinheimera pacifica TaxID=173990 RepID=UPI00216AA214|nr:hypothetical protein [Rheinheimera pacifica]MCS4309304.1 hypothetical protein [Rheinheimera pacifica]
MNNPHLLTQLQQLCVVLQPFQFGIGGSCLLWQLGLETEPNDIDIVCTQSDYELICQTLQPQFSLKITPAHPDYASAHFARFCRDGWPDIDVMAGIAIKRGGVITRWQFQPQRCHWQDGICWMPPADWLQLYQLFNRPQRVAQLKAYLLQLTAKSI